MRAGARLCKIQVAVHSHVEQGKLDLTHHLHGRLEIARLDHFLIQRLRQGRAGFEMFRQHIQRLPFPTPVLHELTGQFHRIPFHAVDAGHARVIHEREHVVQAMTELVEQGGDFVVREQRRLAINWRIEIAGEVGDRYLHTLRVALARLALVHPRTASLVRARVQIHIEAPAHDACGITNFIKTRVRVPELNVCDSADFQTIEAAHHIEHATHHLRLGKVRAQVFVGKIVALLA